MKRVTILLIALSVACGLSVEARVITPLEAQVFAQEFVNRMDPSGRTVIGNPDFIEYSSIDANQPVFYVCKSRNLFNRKFYIVSAENSVTRILAYGEGDLDMNNIPDGFRCLLDLYKEQIEYLIAQEPDGGNNGGMVMAQGESDVITVGPFLSTQWGQKAPYNALCVFENKSTQESSLCVAGCGATAMAQVMRKWAYPDSSPALAGHYAESNTFDIPDLPETTFAWDEMKDYYASGDDADAVATLIRYAGQAQNMNYGVLSSGSGPRRIVNGLHCFGYNATWISHYNEQWDSLILNELNANPPRPIIYYAQRSNGQAHIFDVDGYQKTGSVYYYHVNFGWPETTAGNDVYCQLGMFAPQGSNYFNMNQMMIVDIAPMPKISVTPNALSFTNCRVGETYTKTVKVTGSNLTGNLTLTLNDDTGLYSIDKTSILAEDAANGVTLTVTYHPTTTGVSSANIVIEGGGAEAQSINLEGESYGEKFMTTDVSEVNFESTYTGYYSKKVITITGVVSENIELSWFRGISGAFSLSRTTITPEEAAAGATVIINFAPTWNSRNEATLLIKSQDVVTISLPISGSAIKSNGYLTSSKTDLSFETKVNTPVTETFRLHYSKANGNDAIMVSKVEDEDQTSPNVENSHGGNMLRFPKVDRDSWIHRFDTIIRVVDRPIIDTIFVRFGLKLNVTGDEGFTVSKTLVSINQAENGYDVTVTYSPQSVGIHEAIITITSNVVVAKPLEIRLHGISAQVAQSHLRGDVNHSGVVDIKDVADLIDLQLNDINDVSGDVNMDNRINISDITDLVDLLLK